MQGGGDVHMNGGRVGLESIRACVQCTGLCFVLRAPLFFPFSSMSLPEGTGCALHPQGSESKMHE